MTKKNKPKLRSHLWFYFVSSVFMSFLLTSAIVGILFYFMNRYRFLIVNEGNYFLILAIIIGISLLLGTLAFIHISQSLLKPVEELRKSMRQVAQGDLSVQVIEQQRTTELKDLNTDFNRMISELNSIEALRNDFVTNVSHEFKTPVATIQGYVQLLQKGNLPAKQQAEYYERILDGTRQLTTLTDHILTLTKLETQEIQLKKNNYRLDEQIREVFLFLQLIWEEKQLHLELDLQTVWITANEDLLFQVWSNLLDNAIKYTPMCGTLTLTLSKKGHKIVVTLTDSGIGMTQNQLKHSFDKFYQADRSRKNRGNGLGLALVKKIIELHDADIYLKSKINQGTRVQITFIKQK